MSQTTQNKETTDEVEIISAFAPVKNPPKIVLTPVSEEDIVEKLIVDTFETDSEGNVKQVTKQIEAKRYNRKEYIESFSDEVGLKNILEKVGVGAIAEDKYSILKSNPAGEVTDLRGLSNINNYGDVVALAENAKVTWNNLDPALKKNLSYEKFVTTFDNQDLIDYVNSKLPKKEEGGSQE